MRAAKTPIERLEFGLRWEAYRLAYFSSIGHSTKVAVLTAKLQKLEEDDWLPFRSKEDALQSWQKLGGIRVQVLMAYDLI